jgi:hypothetical protein
VPNAGVRVDHPRGPGETVVPLPGCRLVVWDGTGGPVHSLPEEIGVAVYRRDGRVSRWEGAHARMSGVDSARAVGQTAARILPRLGARRVVRQAEAALQGAFPPAVRTAEGTVSAFFPEAGRILHLLLDLVALGAVEPVCLPRLCFRHGGGTSDLVSRLVTVAESLGWSYDISSAAADGLPTWMLPGSLDRFLAGALKAMSQLCPDRWLFCSTMRAGSKTGKGVLPGLYHVLGFRGGGDGRWQLRTIGGLAAQVVRLGGFVDVDSEGETVRVALPRALEMGPEASGLLTFGGGNAAEIIAGAAADLGIPLTEAADTEELQRLQTGAAGVVTKAVGEHRSLPAALAARIPSQPLMVIGGAVHEPAEPGSPERRLPMPASRESALCSLRDLVRGVSS